MQKILKNKNPTKINIVFDNLLPPFKKNGPIDKMSLLFSEFPSRLLKVVILFARGGQSLTTKKVVFVIPIIMFHCFDC